MKKIIFYIVVAIAVICSITVVVVNNRTARTGDTDDMSQMAVSDSVPYLIEHARWLEPWAYEALAECYRYGKGGLDKSLFNTLISYELAGLSATEIAQAAFEANPNDELGLLNYLMEGRDKKRLTDEDIIKLIEKMPCPRPAWATLFRQLLMKAPAERSDYAASLLATDLSGDELLIALHFNNEIFDQILGSGMSDNTQLVELVGEKMPILYDIYGGRFWRAYREGADPDEGLMAQALEFMARADRCGFLSRHNMAMILNYCENHDKGGIGPFSDEDLARFGKICSKEYRDSFNSPAIEEEEIEVVMDE